MINPYPMVERYSFFKSSGARRFKTFPFLRRAANPTWESPSPIMEYRFSTRLVPATPIIGFALKDTSRPFLRNTSRIIIRAVNSLSAACNGLAEKSQSNSSCSQTSKIWPPSSTFDLMPPTSLCPISTCMPLASSSSIACSIAVRTFPRILCQYCSFKR